MVTVAAAVAQAEAALAGADLYYGHGTDNPRDEAFWLVLAAMDLPADADDCVLDAPVSAAQQARIADFLQQRIGERLPLPYITGEAWFCGLPFAVNRDVLIPRSPIAELIENGFQPWLAAEPRRILDLCAGSGCIGIACTLAFPAAEVHLADISPQALAVAAQNVERYGLQERVRLFVSDLFAALPSQPYDLIVSNPPYVDAEDMADLPTEFHHEPRLGLAAGDDGLDLVRRILADAGRYLAPQGLLVCEVGNSRAALDAAFPELPFVWLDFEYGGDGVFALGAEALNNPGVQL